MKDSVLNRKTKGNGDFFLLIAVILLAVVGTVFIYSASNYAALKTYNDSYYFVKKQPITKLYVNVSNKISHFVDVTSVRKLSYLLKLKESD